MRTALAILLISSFVLVTGCGTNVTKTSNGPTDQVQQEQVSQADSSSKKRVEMYLPLLKPSYYSITEHWDELKLDTVPLMKIPLLGTNDIEYVDADSIKIRKKISVVEGKGVDSGILAADSSGRELEFVLDGKQHRVSTNSPSFFYNYFIHGVCVVVDGDNIIFVRQREYVRKSNRKYKTGPIGIPYVLVVDGKRSELGIIKVGEGNFAIPEPMDSWTYNGFPESTNLTPEGSILKKS